MKQSPHPSLKNFLVANVVVSKSIPSSGFTPSLQRHLAAVEFSGSEETDGSRALENKSEKTTFWSSLLSLNASTSISPPFLSPRESSETDSGSNRFGRIDAPEVSSDTSAGSSRDSVAVSSMRDTSEESGDPIGRQSAQLEIGEDEESFEIDVCKLSLLSSDVLYMCYP